MTRGVAVVGLGEISKVHLSAIEDSSDFHVACVADILETRAKLEAAKRDCAWETNLERVLHRSDVDVVDLLLPHDAHYVAIRSCIERGLPVLCEKPIALNSEQARYIIGLSAAKGVGVHIRMYQHFIQPIAAFLDLIKSSVIGKVHFLELRARGNFLVSTLAPGAWHGTWSRAGGGALIETGIHLLDLALWLFGSPEEFRLSSSSTIETKDRAEDTAFLALQWGRQRIALVGVESADRAEFFTIWMRATGDSGSADVIEEGGELILRQWLPIIYAPRAANEPLQRGRNASYMVIEKQSNWWWEANVQAVVAGLQSALRGGNQEELERAALCTKIIRTAYASINGSQLTEH